ncbi:hypothetical protein TNCV_8541 [Trichonephila clavipes]|nr:hypothetical protein TNCV_8541 [Trichonephila clavipes]
MSDNVLEVMLKNCYYKNKLKERAAVMYYVFRIVYIYVSNTLPDHLTSSLPVPTDDVVSRFFIEFSESDQLVSIYSGMAQSRQASSAARPSQWRYTPKKSCPVIRRERATASAP